MTCLKKDYYLRYFKHFVLSVSLLFGLWTQIASAHSSQSIAPMLNKASPAVVNISTMSPQPTSVNPLFNDPFFRQFFNNPNGSNRPSPAPQAQSAGSGVIVNAEQGVIVTNYHVIKDAEKIVVHYLDGSSSPAKLVGSDPDVDIAVLRVDNPKLKKNGHELKLADSEQLQVGDFVAAIGNPFGLGQTVTTGIVSALGRSGLGIEGYENFIQTDASINPGNSGGALVNDKGELIGINTAIIAPAGGNVGIGFAIPTNMVQASLEQILENGEVRRGVLGVLIQDLTQDLAAGFGLSDQQTGVVISQVQENFGAANAGVRNGDIVTSVDGRTVKSAAALRNVIGLRRVGDVVELGILRNGRTEQLKVKISDPANNKQVAQAPNSPQTKANKSPQWLDERLSGLVLQQKNGQIEIAAIEANSPAFLSSLQPGDVIEEVNRTPIRSIQDLRKIMQANPKQLLLRIVRAESPLYLVIQ